MTAINKKEHYDDRASNMSDARSSGILYLLIGAGIGAATALLLAPKSGADMRGDLSDIAHRGYDQTTDLARRVKEQSSGLIETVKTKAADVLDLAGFTGAGAKTASDTAADNVDDQMSNSLHQLEAKFGRKDSNSNRKSSDII